MNPKFYNIYNDNQSLDTIWSAYLNSDKKTVLVVGGRLGAKSINEAVASRIEFFGQHNLQLIWQTGKLYADRAKELCKGMNHVFVSDFITQMEFAYAASDVVISRSGAMAISELCIVGKPVVFVPFPHAAEDHQTANAKKLVDKNAAVLVEDKNAMNQLIPEMWNLISNASLQNEMKININKLSILNADERVVYEILKYLNS